MARVSTYLNLPGTTEQAFQFYQTVFETEFSHPMTKVKDSPMPETSQLSSQELEMVIHVQLPILGGHILMGADSPELIGSSLGSRSNCYINLEPDTQSETTRLFNALSENGTVEQPLQVMFWGAFYGSLTDQFGVKWMFNCYSQEEHR